MKKIPAKLKINRVEYLGEFVLKLYFSDKKVNEVNFGPFLKSSLHPDVKKYLNKKQFKHYSLKDGDLMWGDFDLIFPISDLYNNSVI